LDYGRHIAVEVGELYVGSLPRAFGMISQKGVAERCTAGAFVFPIRTPSGGFVWWHFPPDLDNNRV
jgi:hypothetical protein